MNGFPCVHVRYKGGNTEATIQAGCDFVSSGHNLVVFPEGNRNYTKDKVMTFRRGAFEIAKRTERPVYPIVVTNSREFAPYNESDIVPIFNVFALPLQFHWLTPRHVRGDPIDAASELQTKFECMLPEPVALS